jgi:formyl-CoA transferase
VSEPGPSGPFKGVRVVEFAHVVAGPLAGGLLADLGADVVHVEPPGTGDAARQMGPHKDGTYLWWKVSGRNKRSVSLDLRTTAGQAVAHRLVAEADVAITSLRASTLERWGLDQATLREVNPRLIVLQVSGMGARSSHADAPGFGKVGEARSGVVTITGFPDGPPVHTGFSHADAVTGLMGAFALSASLFRRERDPDWAGEWIDLALFEPLFRLIEWQVIVHDQLGTIPERAGNRLAVAPAAVINTYKTADDEWITVTSATPRSVLNVVRLLGIDTAGLETVQAQVEAREMLDAELARWCAARPTDAALEALLGADVVASRIFTAADILADPTYAELGDIAELEDPDLGTVRMQNVIPRLAEAPGTLWRTGAALGQDNADVLSRWLGMTGAEIEDLRADGTIGG